MELDITDIKIGKRFRKDLGDFAALTASLQELGTMLQPIVITADHRRAWQGFFGRPWGS
ncbi:MAG TPA: hypothetical protein VKU02_24045 [Gemmataceae bacterium]|nr:hypothetical protein [Gemmataceae bacterium]